MQFCPLCEFYIVNLLQPVCTLLMFNRFSLSEYWMCVYGNLSLSVLCRILGDYWMCLFGNVSLSVLWREFGEYWMCVFGKASLSVLWRIFGEYWM